jgi:hypothetical protein
MSGVRLTLGPHPTMIPLHLHPTDVLSHSTYRTGTCAVLVSLATSQVRCVQRPMNEENHAVPLWKVA